MSADVYLTAVNLTADPELRFTAAGKPMATFSVADNRTWMQGSEERKFVSYFSVTAWGQLAENVCTSLHKGDRVNVVGRLEQQRWEKDGVKRTSVKVVAAQVSPSLDFAEVDITRNNVRDQAAARPQPAQAEEAPGSVYQEEPW